MKETIRILSSNEQTGSINHLIKILEENGIPVQQKVAETPLEFQTELNSGTYDIVFPSFHDDNILHPLFIENTTAMLLTDPQSGSVLHANKAAIEFYGYSEEEFRNKPFSELSTVPQEVIEKRFHLALTSQKNTFSCKHLLVNNDVREVEVTLSPIKINSQIVINVIIQDKTKQKRDERELRTIVETSTALSTASDRFNMFATILKNIEELSLANGVAIAISTPYTTGLNVQASSGLLENWDDVKVSSQQDLVEHVLNTQTPYLSLRIDQDPLINHEKLSFKDSVSLGCTPLIAQDAIIGLLFTCSTRPITEENFKIINLIANISARSIHRILLLEQNFRASLENEVIAEIGRAFNETFDTGSIFQKIVDAVVDIIPNVDRSIIHLYNERKQRLYSVAVRSADPNAKPINFPPITVLPNGEFNFVQFDEEAELTSRMKERKGIAGYVIADGKTIKVDDVRADSRYLTSSTATDIRSMVVVPVLHAERRLGTISAVSTLPNIFTKADELLLEKLSVQATTAIENARLYEAEKVQRQLAEAQARATAILNQTLELDEVLDRILEQTMHAIPCTTANIKLVQRDKATAIQTRWYIDPLNKEVIEDSNDKPFELETPLFLEMLEEKQPVLVYDTATESRWVVKSQHEWIRSFAGTPLIVNDQVIGVLNVDSDQPNKFDQETIRRLQSFADNAAIAIHNARLYQDLEDALKQEQRARSQLIQADKLAGMGRMVASVAHELNNPLQTIKNCMFLINQAELDEDNNELLGMALSEVERLSAIVARLREVYRPQQKDSYQPITIKNLMADVQMLLETHLRRSKVSWIQDPIDEKLTVLGIADQLKQVFLNLCLNAIEAMQPEGGKIRVSTSKSSRQEISIRISDTGPGIAEQDIKNIFEPFFTTKETGMGLGLSICYDITQNHNGRITVENNKDSGSTFTVFLPLVETTDEL
jgi:PAS domain S-box-containing protein